MTSTGLPRRVPRANLAPGIATAQTRTEQRPPYQGSGGGPAASRAAGGGGGSGGGGTGGRPSRSPDDIRAMLSSYRSGLERGRRMAAGSDTFTYQPGGPDEPAGLGPMAPRSNDEPAQ
jgi:hypothetical protein